MRVYARARFGEYKERVLVRERARRRKEEKCSREACLRIVMIAYSICVLIYFVRLRNVSDIFIAYCVKCHKNSEKGFSHYKVYNEQTVLSLPRLVLVEIHYRFKSKGFSGRFKSNQAFLVPRFKSREILICRIIMLSYCLLHKYRDL